jgi:hypothetical protein
MKKIYVLFLMFIFLSSISLAGTVNLPQTGQTKCYDTAGTEILCAGTGQDGEIQAGVEWPSPRFTVNGDCVTDNLTGLMWARNGNLAKLPKNWNDAIDYCNSLTLCGYDDWHLPNVNELESLYNANEPEPYTWLNSQGFINVLSQYYWTSTAVANRTDIKWWVYMYYGLANVTNQITVSSHLFIWPVRSGEGMSAPAPVWKTGQTTSYRTGDDGDLEKGVAWPNPRFTDNGDTVTDNLTGLMWTKNANLPNGPTDWQVALDYVKGMNNGTHENLGYTDWRLPNCKELHSLNDFSTNIPALPSGNPFTNVQNDGYWSSSSWPRATGAALGVYMDPGILINLGKDVDIYHYYVWPVRGGQVLNASCFNWADVIGKYNSYVSGQAVWNNVIECYNQYVSP